MKLFEITPDQINQVVKVFYARIRTHSELGPVFNTHITPEEWPAHEDKIAAFWRNAILKEGAYQGNPMRVHMQTQDVQPTQFTPWLGLFDEVLHDQLPHETAQAFSALAHRIGRGLRMGLEQARHPKSAPPKLF